MKKIYARTLNPSSYDYRPYDIRNDEGNMIIVDGGNKYIDIDNNGYLEDIKKMMKEYDSWDFEYVYHNSIKDLLEDYLPKKENGKRLSPLEMSKIKKSLYEYHEGIMACLKVITGKNYKWKTIRGCCQGEYADIFYPENEENMVSWVEAWFFGTGTEVEVHDCDYEPENADEISGFTFYTELYNIEDLKKEIIKQCYTKDKDVEVVLYLYDKTINHPEDIYKRAE